MKIQILFFLFNLIYLNNGERNSRNLFTDFLKNLLPNRSYHASYRDCECGLNNLRTGRVVNGTDAKTHQPWNAALFMQSSNLQFCSATLISSRWLVTAYHCAMEQSTSSIRILLGADQLQANQVAKSINLYGINNPLLVDKLSKDYKEKRSILETLYQLDSSGNKTLMFQLSDLNPFNIDNVQIHKANRIILNKEFEKSFFNNDIALIELDRDIKFTDYIRPICLINETMFLNEFNKNLPKIKEIINQFDKNDLNTDKNLIVNNFANEERWLMNKELTAYGFGRVGFNQHGSVKLQKLTLKYEPLHLCKSKWQSKLPLYSSLIDETHLCAFNKYSTICHGDSGTGLIVKLNQLYFNNLISGNSDKILIDDDNRLISKRMKSYLIGVASAGWYCESDIPPLFTRISKQLKFIYSNVDSGYWCLK